MREFFANFTAAVKHLPAAVKDGHLHLKGRTYLFVSAILLATVGFSALLAEGVENWKEEERRTGAQMLMSAQATDADMFDYLIETGAGRTLVEGDVSAEEQCVRLPGPDRGCFAVVEEIKERYITRVESYPCGTDKNPQTCTRTVQEWQRQGTDTYSVESATMLGVDLPYRFIPNDTRRVDVEEVREPSSGGFLRNNRDYFYEHSELRYSYRVADPNYYGTVWLNLEEGIDRIGGFWNGKTIPEVLEAHTDEPVTPVVIHWLVQILFIIAGLFGAGLLIVRDLDDGHDHTF